MSFPSGSGVTAIIPTYNRSTFLGEALASLLAQTLPPDEIVVVDDGSTDNTAEVVASISSQIVYIRQPNRGKSAALNLGLQLASNELIYIFDDDDIAAEDCIEGQSGGVEGVRVARADVAVLLFGKGERQDEGSRREEGALRCADWRVDAVSAGGDRLHQQSARRIVNEEAGVPTKARGIAL